MHENAPLRVRQYSYTALTHRGALSCNVVSDRGISRQFITVIYVAFDESAHVVCCIKEFVFAP